MRLCLIGDFSGTPDEGMKNISRTTHGLLSERHDVMALTTRDVLKPGVQFQFREMHPQIIHYLHGPTIRSLMMLSWLKALTGNHAKTIVSATRPYFSLITRKMVRHVKPDLVLTQSAKFETFFKDQGCRVAFFPNGVDLKKFSPVGNSLKDKFRHQLGLPMDKKIVLHVGHIKPNRQLDIFFEIQKMPGIQVVIAGGTHEKADEDLKQKLMDAGIIVVHKYLEDISILYKASDLYLFPILDHKTALPDDYNQIGAIDLPLSILEAMGCNLPVISTRFGALSRLFKEQKGFVFSDSKDQIMNQIYPMTEIVTGRTREMVVPLDWPQVIAGLEQRYKMLTDDQHPALGLSVQAGSF